MDDKWFKQKQKEAGVTAETIAEALGKDRSLVSRIYVGRQKMRPEEAEVFARVLKQPVSEVLSHAGVLNLDQPILANSSELSDAQAWDGSAEERRRVEPVAEALGMKPGMDIWRCMSNAMQLAGLLIGDFLLVDPQASELVKPHDIVLAQVHDWNSGGAQTVLRRFEPPVLISASANTDHSGVHVVDHNNVAIRGKVLASWRQA